MVPARFRRALPTTASVNELAVAFHKAPADPSARRSLKRRLQPRTSVSPRATFRKQLCRVQKSAERAHQPLTRAPRARGTSVSRPDTGEKVAPRSQWSWQERLVELNLAQDAGGESARKSALASGASAAWGV